MKKNIVRVITSFTMGLMILTANPIVTKAGGGGGIPSSSIFNTKPATPYSGSSEKQGLLSTREILNSTMSDGLGKGGGFSGDANLPLYTDDYLKKSLKSEEKSVFDKIGDWWSGTKVKSDFSDLVTGSELSNNMSDKYFDAVGSLPKFQDINIPTSLSLIQKKAPKVPSVTKYSYRLPAPSIDKASLQNKFISGINTNDDEMMAKAVDKFKSLHGMGN